MLIGLVGGSKDLTFVVWEKCGWARMLGIVCVWLAVLLGPSIRCAAASGGPAFLQQDQMAEFAGQTVRHIVLEGVAGQRLSARRDSLPQREGAPLDRVKVADSLRELFSTGLFNTVEVLGQPQSDGVTLIFRGTARAFIGRVSVNGARGATMNTQLERAARLEPGTRFTPGKVTEALSIMRQVLAQNGHNEPKIEHTLMERADEQLTDVAFHVVSGPKARVGAVEVSGDSGMTPEEFRSHAHLRSGSPVDHDTVSRALNGILKYYREKKRLEAEIKLDAQDYAAHKVNYRFTANRGPVVDVLLEGASISNDRLKRLVPVFEEGSVDDDLLNEGNRRLRDYLQSLGYFDVKVDHKTEGPNAEEVRIVYNVNLGSRRKVERVSVEGNHYFDSATLEQMLNVHAAGSIDHHGVYSQALVTADVAALQGVYQNNGFSNVKVTPETLSGSDPQASEPGAGGARTGAPLIVVYHIQEGQQQRVGSLKFEGNDHVDAAKLEPLLNTEPGQLLSPRGLAGDRDALGTEYMRRGFEQVHVDVDEKTSPDDPAKVDVVFTIAEGPQIFVRNVLLTGLHYTRQSTVAPAITLHPGDPLSQAELEQTQRNLYGYALFNEINLAVQNPNGSEANKTVLLQASEARRWAFTYGGGFEVQTGTPVNNCQGHIASGAPCTPSGRTGISPRLLLALTRNNLFGREQSASIQGTYGLLEQKVDLLYQNPRFLENRNFVLTFTGGYANSLDVTTYVASRLEAGFRVTQTYNHPGLGLARANTFVYGFDFRRVKVAEDSLQVFPNFVSTLAAAVRVGGPSFTWVRDTRDNPVDARRGTYTSFQEFLSDAPFAAEAHFNRIDTSNSSYYAFDKGRWVLARNTRYGQERAFGPGNSALLPLPERLYAGGATSLRGFSINSAGPRDPQTGFPIGGAGALVNNLELRLPPPTLPYLGNAVSFVLFHDMGNIFNNSSDVWPSLLRISQPNKDACRTPQAKTVPPEDPPGLTISTGPTGTCSFNYFSHSPGLGVRYHTPVGPIRLDFSYNLNPPIYPVTYDYAHPDRQPFVGEASHFNFFFSLGQTF